MLFGNQRRDVKQALYPEVATSVGFGSVSAATAVDVTLNRKADNAVTKIFIGGVNVLHADDEDYAPRKGEKILRRNFDRDDFEDWIAQQLLIPYHLLTFNCGSPAKDIEQVKFPCGWTDRRPDPAKHRGRTSCFTNVLPSPASG